MIRIVLYSTALLYLLSVSVIDISDAECQNSEACLYDDVFANYNRFARPLRNTDESVGVNVSLNLNSLSGMDDKGEVMHIVGYISAQWKDEFLQWNPADYNHTIYLNLPASKVWLPDLIFENSVTAFYQKTYRDDFLVAIHYTGSIIWDFGGIISTKCAFDISKYPYDTQTCDVNLGVWTYIVTEMYLEVPPVYHKYYQEHSLWKLDKTASDVKFRDGSYSVAVYSLTWSRKARYYVLTVILPIILVMVIALGLFWVPADCGEKASLGITVLLAFSVLQIIITEATPVNSDVTPQISQLVITFMTMSSISLIGAMLSIYVNFKNTGTRVPRFIRNVAFKGLARVLFLSQDVPHNDNRIVPDTETEATQFGKVTIVSPDTIDSSKNPRAGTSELDDILHELKQITGKIDQHCKADFVLSEWKLLAKIIDRVLFWLCIIAIGVTMIGIYF